MLFADLTGFTDLTNRLGAERTFAVIDAFLKMATERVVQNDGFIDKYIGDAVMAFFNVPIRHDDHARRAVAAGVDIIQGLAEVEEQTGQPLRARVGVAKGYARVGRLGSADRRDYTVIGDVANLASRLEGQARPGEVLVADQAFEQVAGDYPTAQPDHLRIKGFADEVTAYRIPVADWQKDGPLPTPRVDRLELSRRVSLATVLFTILGVPCAVVTTISPLAIVVGAGGLLGAVAPVFEFLDTAPVRVPLQAMAVLAAAANLTALWAGRQKRQALPKTRQERRKVLLVAGLSLATLAAVAYETYVHMVLLHMPYF